MGSLDVPRPNACTQPKGGRIGNGGCFLDRIEGDSASHRPEDLVLRDFHIVSDVGQNSRLDEKAILEVTCIEQFSSAADFSTFTTTDFDVIGDPLKLCFADNRPDLGLGIDTPSDLQITGNC